MKTALKHRTIILIVICSALFCFDGFRSFAQSNSSNLFQVFCSETTVKYGASFHFQIEIQQDILENDWITLLFPAVFPVPAYSVSHDETGKDYTTEYYLGKNIRVNFLCLDPKKPLPVINYAENSLSFLMPRTLKIRKEEPTFLWISLSYTLPDKPCVGKFGFWHSSLSNLIYSNSIQVTEKKHIFGLEDVSLKVSSPVWDEPTSWEFTSRTNESLVLKKNIDTVGIFFLTATDMPKYSNPSQVTVNGIPCYLVEVSGNSIEITMPVTILENQTMVIRIEEPFGIKTMRKPGKNEILFSIRYLYQNGLTTIKYSLIFDVQPGKPLISASIPVAGKKTTYTFIWSWFYPPNQNLSKVEIRWPNQIPLEDECSIRYSVNGKEEKSGDFLNGIVSLPMNQKLEPNQPIQIQLLSYQIKNSYKSVDFVNPSPREISFAFRYDPDSDWSEFPPLTILSDQMRFKTVNWVNRYTAQPIDVTMEFEQSSSFKQFLTEGFFLVFSDSIKLPASIPPESIYCQTDYSNFTEIKNTMIDSHTLFLKVDSQKIQLFNIKTLNIHINPKSGILNPENPDEMVSIGFRKENIGSLLDNAQWSLVHWVKPASLVVVGGILGKNNWYTSPPMIKIESSDPASIVTVNGFRVNDLAKFCIPLLEGQNKQYFTLENDYPHQDFNNVTNLQYSSLVVTIDTIPVKITQMEPSQSWSITGDNSCKVKGIIAMPETVDYNGPKPLLDQSLQIQDRMVVIQADGSFETLVPLQFGKNNIQIFLVDWAGHSLNNILHVYRGKGLVLQINNATAWSNGKKISGDVPPLIYNGTTFVPLRLISEAFGAKVTYQSQTKPPSVIIQRENQKIEFFVGSKNVKVNGKVHILNVSPLLVQNRMLIPLRFLAEIWKMETIWEPKDQVVAILFPV